MADKKGEVLWCQVYEPFATTYLKQDIKGTNKFNFAGKEVLVF